MPASVKVRRQALSTGEHALYLHLYLPGGRRRKQFLGLRLNGNRDHDREALRLAETARSQAELDLFTGKHALISSTAGKIPFLDFCRGKVTPERHGLRKALPHLEAFDDKITLEAVDERFLDDFRRFLESRVTAVTAANYFAGITRALGLAERERAILRNPAKAVARTKVPEKVRAFLTAEEIQRLADAPIMGEDGAGGEIKRGFLFACFTGLRWSDLLALTWGEVRDGRIMRQQTKTGRVVVIPLHETARRIIEPADRIHAADELVFQLPGNVSRTRYLRQWGKAAGIARDFSFHASRHSAATLLLESGADLFTVQRILGHTKADQTAVYARVSDSLKKKAVDAMPSITITKREAK